MWRKLVTFKSICCSSFFFLTGDFVVFRSDRCAITSVFLSACVHSHLKEWIVFTLPGVEQNKLNSVQRKERSMDVFRWTLWITHFTNSTFEGVTKKLLFRLGQCKARISAGNRNCPAEYPQIYLNAKAQSDVDPFPCLENLSNWNVFL